MKEVPKVEETLPILLEKGLRIDESPAPNAMDIVPSIRFVVITDIHHIF